MVTPLESRVCLPPWQSRCEAQEERTNANKIIMLREIAVRFMCTFFRVKKISKRKRVETGR